MHALLLCSFFFIAVTFGSLFAQDDLIKYVTRTAKQNSKVKLFSVSEMGPLDLLPVKKIHVLVAVLPQYKCLHGYSVTEFDPYILTDRVNRKCHYPLDADDIFILVGSKCSNPKYWETCLNMTYISPNMEYEPDVLYLSSAQLPDSGLYIIQVNKDGVLEYDYFELRVEEDIHLAPRVNKTDTNTVSSQTIHKPLAGPVLAMIAIISVILVSFVVFTIGICITRCVVL